MKNHSLQVNKKCTLEGHRDSVYSLCTGPGFELLSAGGDGMLVGWNPSRTTDGELIAKLDNSVYVIANSVGTGEVILAHNYDGIHLIDPIKKTDRSLILTKGAIYALEVVGNDLFVGDSLGVVYKIDLVELVVRDQWKVSSEYIRCIKYLENGQLAVGGSDNVLRILDPDTGTLLSENKEHGNSIFGLVQGSRGLYSASRDARIRRFNTASVEKNEEEIIAHMYTINDIVYNPTLDLLVTCSMDKTIKIWDETTGTLLKVLDKARHAAHGTSVNRLLWTESGLLASCSDDRTISIWDISHK